MARHEDLIIRRTAEERGAYLQGFAAALEMVERRGVDFARRAHDLAAKVIDPETATESEWGKAGMDG